MQDLNAIYVVISICSHYPFDQNAKTFDTKGKTFSIRWFCILIKRVMTVYENYNVIAFKSWIQIFTVQWSLEIITYCDDDLPYCSCPVFIPQCFSLLPWFVNGLINWPSQKVPNKYKYRYSSQHYIPCRHFE